MAKDPAFLFYPSDFLTGTMFMSNEQVGIYIRVLCAQHQHGGMLDKISFNSIVGENSIIRGKFIEVEDGFFNERLMIEIEKRNKKSSNLSANALQRWEKEKQKKSKSNANALHGHMPTEDINENEIVIKDKKGIKKEKGHKLKISDPLVFNFQSDEFLNTWQKLTDQPKWRKKSRDALQESLNMLAEFDELTAIKMMKRSIAGNWQGVFEIKENGTNTTASRKISQQSGSELAASIVTAAADVAERVRRSQIRPANPSANNEG